MRLNPDCVRDILLQIESKTTFNEAFGCDIDNMNELFPGYDWETIIYHTKQCELSNLIYNIHFYGEPTSFFVQDLTPQGHEFLANIRQDTIWNNIKDIAKTIGSSSLTAITQISANVITEIIRAKFNV